MSNNNQRTLNFASGLVSFGVISSIAVMACNYLDVLKIPNKAIPGLILGALVFNLLLSGLLISEMKGGAEKVSDVNQRLSNPTAVNPGQKSHENGV